MQTIHNFRQIVGSKVAESFFEGLSRASLATPKAKEVLQSLRILRDIPYGSHDAQTLDIYLPQHQPNRAVFYIHGGGFRILSKDTHWLMGVAFAQRGMAVYNINYRLAPQYRYPAALEDVALAWMWATEHAARLGLDPSKFVVAGESAGANLASALAVATCAQMEERFAKDIFGHGLTPAAVLANCGMLQVSDWERFNRRKQLHPWISDRIREVTEAYLPDTDARPALADPLLILENHERWDRPLPPFFSSVGTRDPLLDDTRRLHQALTRLNVRSTSVIYPGEVHAFHAFIWRAQARQCWKDQFAFLEDVL